MHGAESLEVLQFDYLIRVPLNVLKFLPNVLESCLNKLKIFIACVNFSKICRKNL